MLSVQKIGSWFKVTVTDKSGSISYHSDTIEGVHEAINHYYNSGPRAGQHNRNAIDHCPICRSVGGEKKEPILKLVK